MEEKKNRLAIVKVRGNIRVNTRIKNTMRLLRLYRKNSCTVVPNNKQFIGMLKKVKDYVTWGEIDEKTFNELFKKRAKVVGNKKLDENYLKEKGKTSFDDFTKEFFSNKKELNDVPGLKKFFRLTPPVHGFERKGIKKPYSMGGALGYRGNAINDLIRRMI